VARSTDGVYRSALLDLGLGEPVVGPLAAYLGLLADWSRRVNLTGARTPSAQVDLLIRDALPLPELLAAGSVIDVGSGNGSPGLILGVLCPDRRITLLEPRQRRWAFLREASRVVGRPDIEVLRQRHDEYVGSPAANVTVRALRLAAPELCPLLERNGRIIALGALPSESEGMLVRTFATPGRGAIHVLDRAPVSRETLEDR
jgi:16S rRNA (guanine527-N7)-methyltransferase